MTQTTVKELTRKIDQLERLIRVHIEQEQDKDWLDDPKLVKKLDDIAKREKSIPASTLKF